MISILFCALTGAIRFVNRWIYRALLGIGLTFVFSFGAFAQSESECLQSFNVQPDTSITYIFSDATGSKKAPVTMSCTNAELFREKLYVEVDKDTYDSITNLRSALADARQQIQQVQSNVVAATDEATVKGLIKGAGVVVATPLAVATTAACASGVINGAGLAACGAAAVTSVAAVDAWNEFLAVEGDLAATQKKAIDLIQKLQAQITSTQQQLDATVAGDMKNSYSQLFLGICRAVKEQCL